MKPPSLSRRLMVAFGRFLALFVLLFALLAVRRFFENEWMKALELQGYLWLQNILDHRPEQRLVVVDISDLRQKDGMTPRAPLLDLLSKLKGAKAKAIGVDIDFSPEDQLFVAPNDPSFFDSCRKLGIPVFLGVARTAGSSRAAWLGKPEFADLAAAIVIPHDTGTIAEGGAPAPYPVYIPRLGSDASGGSSQSDDLRSLGVALASASQKDVEHVLEAQDSFLLESIAERPIVQGRVVPEFTVDDGFVEHLQETSVAATWDATGKLTTSFDRGLVADSLVLAGDLKGASPTDLFDTPRRQKASGVLLHASAALTLLRGPVSVPTELARTGIDIFFTALAASVAVWFKKRYGHDSHSEPWLPRFILLPLATSMLVGAVISVFAVSFVILERTLWFDWLILIVGGALLEVFTEPTIAAKDWYLARADKQSGA